MKSLLKALAMLLLTTTAGATMAQIKIIQASPVAPDPLRGPIIGNPLAYEGPSGLMPLLQSKPAGDARYQPQIGQDGKDVIWVPTPDSLIKAMLTTAEVGPRDYVVDLGSGDGRIAIAAARDFGARAHGIEYNPEMVMLALRSAAKEGVGAKVTFETADIFQSDFSRATVVTLYLLPSLNLKLRDTLLKMKPGTRIASHAFDMAEWTPDQTIVTDDATGFFWIVPADASGRWAFEIGNERFVTQLAQRFQMLGAAKGNPIADGRMRGTGVRLTRSNGATLQGEVSGNMMVGSGWMATRIRAAE